MHSWESLKPWTGVRCKYAHRGGYTALNMEYSPWMFSILLTARHEEGGYVRGYEVGTQWRATGDPTARI
jgi:hypothetical protein